MRSTFLISTVLASLVLASSASALADDEPTEPTEDQPKPKKKPKPAEAAPSSYSAAPAGAASEKADHDLVIGKMGIGYLGGLPTPLGVGRTLTSHIVGIRYWFNPGMGLTAGLGFGTTSGSTSTSGTTTDLPAATSFAVKGGLPIALTTGKHYAFVLEPQLVFGYAMQTEQIPNGGGTIEHTGYRFALGATAGGEIHFGFMGIPELSLVGSVGLAVDSSGGKTKNSPTGGASVETARSQTTVATFTRENPWNIFTSNIAAIYYF